MDAWHGVCWEWEAKGMWKLDTAPESAASSSDTGLS